MKRINYFEIDVPHCANTYGVSPCTAALSGNSKCFNTPATCQDRDHLRPGYPLVDSVTETEFGSDATAHSGFLPDGIASGDLLIAIFANDGNAAITTPTNWTKKADQASGTDVRTSVFVKKADGTEDATSTAGVNLGTTSAGTPFGDMTGGAGLSSSFDGDTTDGASACSRALSATQAFIGLRVPGGARIHSATIHGSNDAGFVSGINPTMTITLRGKNDSAFSSAVATAITEGSQIGSITAFADTADESAGRAFTMSDQATAYEYIAAFVTHNGASNSINVAELTLNEGHPFASFTTASAEQAALQVFHILKNNWTGDLNDMVVQVADEGTTAAPDPDEIAPSWELGRTLYIAAFGASSVTTVDAYPDGFGNGLNSQGGTGTTGASVSAAYIVARAESLDPAPFDLAASAPGVSVGIAVKYFDEVTLRFASPAPYLPKSIEAYPAIESIDHTPAVIGLGDNIGQRAGVKVTLIDAPHSDSGPGFDPYLVDRTYNPFTRGTLWGKFRARQPFLQGSPCRLIRGLEGQSLEGMTTYNFLVESTDGPGTNARFSIMGKDLLKMLDSDRAQAPVPCTATTIGSLSSGGTTVSVTPTGVGNAEFPSSGYVCIGGNEVCSFTRSLDAFTLTRGQLGSTASAHSAGERVQLVLVYTSEDVADIIADLAINYAGVSPNYIPLTSWQTETHTYLNQLYTGTITEPTGVGKLISELVEQAGLSLWATDDPFLINLQVLRAVASSAAVIDETVMRDDVPLKITEQPEKRASEIWTYYAQRDPTKPLDNTDNYANLQIEVSAQAELDYETSAIRKVFSRWIAAGGENTASILGQLLLSRYNPAPRKFEFGLFESGSTPVAPGIGYLLSHPSLQDETGDRDEIPIQITSLKTVDEGVNVIAEEMTVGTPVGLTGDVITINTSQNDVNLETMHDLLYPVAVSGDNVVFYISSGVIVGSSTGGPAVTVGNFAAGVNLYLIIAGTVAGYGGDGGDGGDEDKNGRDGTDGGTALYTRRAINVDASLGIIGGGGGGGGGGAGAHDSGAGAGGGGGGGGGAGRTTGNGGDRGAKVAPGTNGSPGDDGGLTSGGAGGNGGVGGGGGGDGGDGGDLGLDGSDGTNASGGTKGLGGNTGNATDGNSFITYGSWNSSTSTFTPGAIGTEDIRGPEVN